MLVALVVKMVLQVLALIYANGFGHSAGTRARPGATSSLCFGGCGGAGGAGVHGHSVEWEQEWVVVVRVVCGGGPGAGGARISARISARSLARKTARIGARISARISARIFRTDFSQGREGTFWGVPPGWGK